MKPTNHQGREVPLHRFKFTRKQLLSAYLGVWFLLIGIAVFIFLYWPVWFPKFKLDSCVVDMQRKRVYKVKGTENWLKRGWISADVLEKGMIVTLPPDSVFAGDEKSFNPLDPRIRKLDCPY